MAAAATTTAAAVATADPSPDVNDQSASAPRKRRRRAPATGAADDCFACQEARSTCDRRRPYCTQCIDRGKTCSGYKTRLTWGVGVASRGKLRGLSLPIAGQKTKKAAGNDSKPSIPKSVKSPTHNKSIPPTPTSTAARAIPLSSTFDVPSGLQYNIRPPGAQDHVQSPASASFTFTSPSTSRPPVPLPRPPQSKKNARRHSLQPLQMPMSSMGTDFSPVPMTAGVYGGYNGPHLSSAISDSPVDPSYQQYHEQMSIDRQYSMQSQWTPSSYHGSYQSAVSASSWHSADSFDSNITSETGNQNFRDEETFSPDMSIMKTLDGMLGDHGANTYRGEPYTEGRQDDEQEQYEDLDGFVFGNTQQRRPGMELALSFPNSFSAPQVGNTRGLRELINYYNLVIAPVIVAFDGPTNPYRTHIIRLASESEALQHAIAALSASNLRMRREYESLVSKDKKLLTDGNTLENVHDVSVRNSSMAHNILCSKVEQADTAPAGKHSQRELYHKSESIKALNATLSQLREQSLGNDDTVLATLLVLCLYHICDTGVAKFRTQFAGVKKLLALRNRRSSSATAGRDSAWLLTMFRWFDAMTATVNDREGQFDTDPDMLGAEPVDEWALENLAGCDGRLFAVISKLGRLNLLSQGKAVSDGMATPRPKPPRQPADLAFDGNGWGQVLPESDKFFPSSASASGDDAPPSPHTQFGAEWWALRQALLDWQFDQRTVPPSMRANQVPHTPNSTDTSASGVSPASTVMPSDTTASPVQQSRNPQLSNSNTPSSFSDISDPHARDLRHISEAFRHSALLYLERLAYPRRSSAASGFKQLVDAAIVHIRAVKSDVYLLWPLFIAGTECVEPAHRDLIRARCNGIQSDSGFYNNTSTLDVLEKIWADRDALGPEAYARDNDLGSGGAFKWRKAMDRGEEEYIVI